MQKKVCGGTHLPLFLDKECGEYGCLEGHLTSANLQWKDIGEQEVLAVFQGPHHYISPQWYDNNDVPTWNYFSIHAYGTVEFIEDEDELLSHLEKMVLRYEGHHAESWKMNSVSSEDIAKMIKAIVGFRIKCTRLEAKAKLGRNKAEEDQLGYIKGLKDLQTDDALSLALLAEGKLK